MEAAALRGPPSENPRGLRARVQQVGLGEVLAHVRRPSPVVSSLCYTCTFKKKVTTIQRRCVHAGGQVLPSSPNVFEALYRRICAADLRAMCTRLSELGATLHASIADL